MKKDKQKTFDSFVGPLEEMVEQNESRKVVQIPADGNWFKLSFDAVAVKENRLVISASKIKSGLETCSYDPSLQKYVVEFDGTRAAYIYGSYENRHPAYGWPYIHWDVRSYASHPTNKDIRVYVHNFRASDEIRKLIIAMEDVYGTSNVLNTYINDNWERFRMGIRAKKSPSEIEKAWSLNLMESLGYQYVEAFDTGFPKGNWDKIKVHWCKKEQDLRAEYA